MNISLSLLLLVVSSLVYGQQKSTTVAQFDMKGYNITKGQVIEDKEKNSFILQDIKCKATCDGIFTQVEIDEVTSKNYTNLSRKANHVCRSKLISKCSKNIAKATSNEKIVQQESSKQVNQCDWVEGKQVHGTVTHSSLQCQSAVCAGQVICSTASEPQSFAIVCLPKSDGTCPSATKCMQDKSVFEVLEADNAKFKIKKKVNSAVKE